MSSSSKKKESSLRYVLTFDSNFMKSSKTIGCAITIIHFLSKPSHAFVGVPLSLSYTPHPHTHAHTFSFSLSSSLALPLSQFISLKMSQSCQQVKSSIVVAQQQQLCPSIIYRLQNLRQHIRA